MAFLSPEQMLAVRKFGSKLITLEALDGKQIRIVKMSSNAQLESEALQQEVRAGKRTQADFLRFMLQSACAEVDGTLLTEQDARDLFAALPLDEVTILIKEISALIDGAVTKLKKSAGAQTVDAQAEETPTEKKDAAS